MALIHRMVNVCDKCGTESDANEAVGWMSASFVVGLDRNTLSSVMIFCPTCIAQYTKSVLLDSAKDSLTAKITTSEKQ